MYVYYSIDRDGFIERLCENKDKPELNCDGKCMLSKMLSTQNEDNELPMPAIGWEQVLVFFEEPQNYIISSVKEVERTYFHYTNNYSYNFTSSSYKPPTV